jgi:hypothetical protein
VLKKKIKILIYECESHGRTEQRFDVHIKHINLNIKMSDIIDRRIYTIEYKICIKKKNCSKYDVIFESEIYGSRDKLVCTTHGIFFTQTIHNHFNTRNNRNVIK